MEGLRAWLSEHWPDALSALAALATLVIVLTEKAKRRELVVDGQLRISIDRDTGLQLATLTLQRPTFGMLEVESLSASGWDLALRTPIGETWAPKFPPPARWDREIAPKWMIDMYGQHQSAIFWFWVRPSSSSRSRTAQKVMRLKARISLKSARSLTRTITIDSNTMA